MSKQSRLRAKKEIKNFWMVATLAIFLLLAGVVLQINGCVHQNSFLKDYQKQISLISTQNDALEAKLSQSNSLEIFNQYTVAQASNYEKIDVSQVRYVHASSDQFAKK